jgi:hypothetical protein
MSKDDQERAGGGPASDDKRLGRRLFFFKVATILTGAAALGAPRHARTQETDSDSGEGADAAGKGRRGGRPGGFNANTDSDWGPNRDPVGGRRRPAETKDDQGGVTDSDSGPSADKGGKGRGGAK